MLGAALAAATLALPLGAAAHDPKAPAAGTRVALSTEQTAAAAVVDAFHAALERGDTAAALAMMSDDVLVLEQGGAEKGKAAYAAEHLAADAAFARAVRSERRVVKAEVSGAMALVASESTAVGQFRERAVDSAGAETMILRREGGRWRIVHVHWSSRSRPVSR